MKLNCQVEFNDYLSAQYLHIWPRHIVISIGAFLVALIFFFSESTYKLPAIAACSWLVLYYFLLLPLIAKYQFKKHPILGEPVLLEVIPEGFKYEADYGSGETKWRLFQKWHQNKKVILLYQSKRIFQIIPKSAFSGKGQEESFIEAIRNNIGKRA